MHYCNNTLVYWYELAGHMVVELSVERVYRCIYGSVRLHVLDNFGAYTGCVS